MKKQSKAEVISVFDPTTNVTTSTCPTCNQKTSSIKLDKKAFLKKDRITDHCYSCGQPL